MCGGGSDGAWCSPCSASPSWPAAKGCRRGPQPSSTSSLRPAIVLLLGGAACIPPRPRCCIAAVPCAPSHRRHIPRGKKFFQSGFCSNPFGADDDETAKLLSALQNWGLFLAVGHGMDPGFLTEMMEVTRGFFNLPLDEKQKYSNLANGKEFRFEGYGNDMVLSEDQVLDWCDRLYLTVEPESRIVRSLWPAQPPAFSDVLREYTTRCREIAGVVLASLARLLGLHEGRFVGMMSDGVAMTHARFNYYPRCPEPDRVLGLKPHSDASVITVVLIDDAVGGLQVQKPNDDDGVWYDVPIVPNALLVNVGDVTEIMSNGLFRSPVHRAVTNAESDRVSLAMFYTLDSEKEIEPLPELVDDKRPRRYRKTTTKDYLALLFERFTRGERALDAVKIDLNDD